METRTCKTCSTEQPLSSYWTSDKARGYLRATCKECDKAAMRRYYANNAEYRAKVRVASREREKIFPRTREQSRRYNMKSNYGLTTTAYEAMVEAQGHKCALCGSDKNGRHNSDHWIVDHCHDTGRIRGLLCHACNVRLGGYEFLVKNVGVPKLLAYLSG